MGQESMVSITRDEHPLRPMALSFPLSDNQTNSMTSYQLPLAKIKHTLIVLVRLSLLIVFAGAHDKGEASTQRVTPALARMLP